MVLLGLALFLIGLERALFPIGETMAEQLTEQAGSLAGAVRWENYWLVLPVWGRNRIRHDRGRALP